MGIFHQIIKKLSRSQVNIAGYSMTVRACVIGVWRLIHSLHTEQQIVLGTTNTLVSVHIAVFTPGWPQSVLHAPNNILIFQVFGTVAPVR